MRGSAGGAGAAGGGTNGEGRNLATDRERLPMGGVPRGGEKSGLGERGQG